MEVNKFNMPIPIILIALFYIIGTFFSSYDLFFSGKGFRPYHPEFWFDSFFLISGIIIGLGLPLRSKTAYVLLVIEALLAFAGGGFIIILFFWMDISQQLLWFIAVMIVALYLWFLLYRYIRSPKIRNLYFANEI